MACAHQNPFWVIKGCNEDGWECSDCGAKLGFRPDLDREHTQGKVHGILLMLHEYNFHYISNSTMGDGMVAEIEAKCVRTGIYDQQSIIVWLLAADLGEHQRFWKERAKQQACGHPSRTLKGTVATCNACGHEVDQKPFGPTDLPF